MNKLFLKSFLITTFFATHITSIKSFKFFSTFFSNSSKPLEELEKNVDELKRALAEMENILNSATIKDIKMIKIKSESIDAFKEIVSKFTAKDLKQLLEKMESIINVLNKDNHSLSPYYSNKIEELKECFSLTTPVHEIVLRHEVIKWITENPWPKNFFRILNESAMLLKCLKQNDYNNARQLISQTYVDTHNYTPKRFMFLYYFIFLKKERHFHFITMLCSKYSHNVKNLAEKIGVTSESLFNFYGFNDPETLLEALKELYEILELHPYTEKDQKDLKTWLDERLERQIKENEEIRKINEERRKQNSW